MATNKKTTKTSKSHSYRISRAIVSLTFLGTMWRTALFVAILIAMLIISTIFHTNNISAPLLMIDAQEALWSILAFMSAFVLYDTLYVYVVQRYKEMDIADKLILFSMELMVVAALSLQVVFNTFIFVDPAIQNEAYSFIFWLLVMAVLLLPLRAFIGVSYVVMTRKAK